MAKEVTISISPWTVYSGKALAALSQEPLNGCSFPLVRTLKIDFTHGQDNKDATVLPPDAEDNIGAFVHRIRQMAPGVNLIKLSGGLNSWERTTATALPIDSLANQLIQLVSRVEFTSGFDRVFHFMEVDAIRNLTHIHATVDLDGEQTMRLIRQNAPTLQYLNILSRVDTDFSGIIQDIDGGCVEYPRLRTLVMEQSMSGKMPRQYAFGAAAPFPNLRRLVCGMGYPFGDDLVLFRGNAATLEHLRLVLTTFELVLALLRHNVFTPTSHPKLQCVMLIPPLGIIQATYADYTDLIRLMMDIGPDAAVREISAWYLDPVPHPPVFSLLTKHASLQVLALPGLRLPIWNAMTLIQSLPLLSDLHARPPTLDPMPAGVTKRKLIAYVHSNYSPMGTRFRCWHIGNERVKELKDAVIPFVLPALACPNFDYVAIFHFTRERFAELLEQAINMATYKKHAPRLRRLLLNRLE
ncbi:hypothetical protein GGI19_000032 [Coemansia pectinata]|uniref:Uncharacterized protein n=1 Tax=Coemansia pectinata TaxID=1052879 RepID=A0A9W8H7J4_9FUNG|nr:hypothetical protein GGI19_000032 [Coemansia pectinata]